MTHHPSFRAMKVLRAWLKFGVKEGVIKKEKNNVLISKLGFSTAAKCFLRYQQLIRT